MLNALLLLCTHGSLAPTTPQVRVCQVGYLPHESKFAMVVGASDAPAAVYRVTGGEPVLVTKASPAVQDLNSGDAVSRIDFTALATPGKYIVRVQGLGDSDPFEIGANVYQHPLRLAMRSYTGQRCGIAVSLAPDFPEFHHPACHTHPAVFDPSSGRTGTLEATGGWHDAGDYGRYIVNSGITTGTLLWAFEMNPKALRRTNLDLPDHKESVPDFLTEIRWNIDWMLKMQDSDGGVWQKETTAFHAGFVMPEKDTAPMRIIGQVDNPHKVTAATADFAAVTAIAARVFRRFDAPYANRCLAASERAWTWSLAHPDSLFRTNPPGNYTGGYSDDDPSDEMLWAAAELFRTTGGEPYNRYFLGHYTKWTPTISATRLQGWPQVANLGMFTYALGAPKGSDRNAVQQIKADTVKAADVLVKRASADGYMTPMAANDYGWGSNGSVANYAMMLQIADRFHPTPAYRNAALDCLHYMFGRNTFATSFVTQLGVRWPMHPHHRPSADDGVSQPWPGLLVGGPNGDGKANPAKQWQDAQGDFRTNETAINWNAPLVFALACARDR